MDLYKELLLSDGELKDLIYESDILWWMGDAIDHARYRDRYYMQAEHQFFKMHGWSIPSTEFDSFRLEHLSGRVETLDLLLSSLNGEVPGSLLESTYLLRTLAPNREGDFYSFVATHHANEIAQRLDDKYVLEIRFNGQVYKTSLLSQ